MFKLTIPMNGLMLVTFLYELTFYDQKIRKVIFKTQLAKVFMTILSCYFMSIIYSSYFQSLSEYIVKHRKQHAKFIKRRLELEEAYGSKENKNIL